MVRGKISKIKDTNGEVAFPVTSSKAVYMEDGSTTVEKKFEQVGSQLEHKTNFLDLYKNKDIAVCVGYSRDNTKPGLFVTYDGVNISRVCDFDNFPNSKWDFGLIFLNGYFYMCYDYIDDNFNEYNDLDKSLFFRW